MRNKSSEYLVGEIQQAMAGLPKARYVMTSAHGDVRKGIYVEWVQQCAENPPMVVIAIRKGQPLSPLIRDSKRFALCQLPDSNNVLESLVTSALELDEDSVSLHEEEFHSRWISAARSH